MYLDFDQRRDLMTLARSRIARSDTNPSEKAALVQLMAGIHLEAPGRFLALNSLLNLFPAAPLRLPLKSDATLTQYKSKIRNYRQTRKLVFHFKRQEDPEFLPDAFRAVAKWYKNVKTVDLYLARIPNGLCELLSKLSPVEVILDLHHVSTDPLFDRFVRYLSKLTSVKKVWLKTTKSLAYVPVLESLLRNKNIEVVVSLTI